MKINKVVTKLALASALLGTVGTTSVSTLTTTANASSGLPTSTTKDGITYTKPRYFNNWVPGNNVGDLYNLKFYKLTGSLVDPGREWDKIVGAGNVHGREFFVAKDNSDNKGLIPAEFSHVPYGFKFKKNHKPVECYYGSLAESYDGYDEYLDEYEIGHTIANTIYSDHENSHRELTLAYDVQDKSKKPRFLYWFNTNKDERW